MKVHSLNKKIGVCKLELTRPEDCWVLTHIVERDDLVRATTLRKIRLGGEEDRKATVIKRPVTLTIKVEKPDLSEFSLRVLGTVVEGPEDIPRGVHHTIELEVNDSFTLTKPGGFAAHHLSRIEEASRPAPNQVLLVVHDREEAYICLVTTGYKILVNLKGKVAKKVDGVQSEDFYSQITKSVEEYVQRHNPSHLIVASPAFFKEDLIKVFSQELKKKVIMATCSSVTKNGIEEVLRRDEVKTAVAQDRLSQHLKIVELLQAEIARDGKAAYGTKEVEQAAQQGAIHTLLVTEEKIKTAKENRTFTKIDEIMVMADQTGAVLALLDSETEPGKRIDGLGGIAAILRYKLS